MLSIVSRRLQILAAGGLFVVILSSVTRADSSGISLSPDDLVGRTQPVVSGLEQTVAPLYMVDTIGNPAQSTRPPGLPPESQPSPSDEGGLVHPWLMPPVKVVGQNELREDQLVGSYAQPVWTADRRFAETRVYVQPEGALDAEFWLIPTVNRHGRSEILSQYEVEIGFPGRIQMDLYLVNRFEGSGGPTYTDESIEFRYAFANWNEIWGNPTYYIEFIHQDQGPDQIEQKFLFGGDISPRLHWGWDLTFQHSFGDDYENTYETTAGLSYTLVDNRFDVGVEAKVQLNTFHGDRRHIHDNTFIGPSFQFRPLPRMHVDFTPLIGVDAESPVAEMYLIVGWEF